jgi:transcriptional regulator with XRE-family HTH domain
MFLRRLGGRLRTARVRRGLSAEALAAKLGIGRRALRDAESGKPSTSVAVYIGMLWALDLMGGLEQLADPSLDVVGQALARSEEKTRPRPKKPRELDNDF